MGFPVNQFKWVMSEPIDTSAPWQEVFHPVFA